MPPHSGEALREYLPDTLTQAEIASRLGIAPQALLAVLNGRAGIGAELAVRLSKALGTTADFWLGLQAQYDPWRAMCRPMQNVRRLAAWGFGAIPCLAPFHSAEALFS